MKSIFDDYLHITAKALDLRMKRQNIVAGNLANISNPKYKACRLEFEEQLQAAIEAGEKGQMTRTNVRHLPVAFRGDNFQANFQKETEYRVIQGEDAVDLDKEMAIQSKNAIQYKVLAFVLQKGFTGMAEVIQKGSK